MTLSDPENADGTVVGTLIKNWHSEAGTPAFCSKIFSSADSGGPPPQAIGWSTWSHLKSAVRSVPGRKWTSKPSAAIATSSQSARALAYRGVSLRAALSGSGAKAPPALHARPRPLHARTAPRPRPYPSRPGLPRRLKPLPLWARPALLR